MQELRSRCSLGTRSALARIPKKVRLHRGDADIVSEPQDLSRSSSIRILTSALHERGRSLGQHAIRSCCKGSQGSRTYDRERLTDLHSVGMKSSERTRSSDTFGCSHARKHGRVRKRPGEYLGRQRPIVDVRIYRAYGIRFSRYQELRVCVLRFRTFTSWLLASVFFG